MGAIMGGAQVWGAGSADLAGSASCRECHEEFHSRWESSWHRLSLRPYTTATERGELLGSDVVFQIGEESYRLDLTAGQVVATSHGAERSYAIEQVLGGRDVIYLLTALEGGRLQVLPLGYDVRRREWFEIAASIARHFEFANAEPVDWRAPAYTFNASCYGCHVSHGRHQYDPTTATLESSWAEQGISCETCHGPGQQHVRLARASPAGLKLEDWRIEGLRDLEPERADAVCASCHGKLTPLTREFTPGARLFDHFDIVAYEDLDFTVDGRDRGENYTVASWRLNRCVLEGGMSCVHCHTSSGRYRFSQSNANTACLPCHAERVANPSAHSRHLPDSTGNRCVACHMPRHEFARMVRHDHSLRPPMPALTRAHGSPNACNDCHTDRDALWADTLVRSWHSNDYQAPVLVAAGFIAEARQQDWRRLQEMIEWLGIRPRDEMFATSLIRLLANSADERKWRALIDALDDPSPLVRSSAARALHGCAEVSAVDALRLLLKDDYRLVRMQAAASLARWTDRLNAVDRVAFRSAAAEFEETMEIRGEDPESLNELGHFYFDQGAADRALVLFERSLRLRPVHLETLVSAATAAYRTGDVSRAEALLRRAVEVNPDDSTPKFNLGVLLESQGRWTEAQEKYEQALARDPGHERAARRLAALQERRH